MLSNIVFSKGVCVVPANSDLCIEQKGTIGRKKKITKVIFFGPNRGEKMLLFWKDKFNLYNKLLLRFLSNCCKRGKSV